MPAARQPKSRQLCPPKHLPALYAAPNRGVKSLNESTLGVRGNVIAGSPSCGPAVLVPLHVPAAGLANLIELFRQCRNWDGLIVTVPHKVDIARYLDELGDSARLTGAVNTIRKNADGRLSGANFDGEGFMRGLQSHGHDVRGRRLMLIGAGGAD